MTIKVKRTEKICFVNCNEAMTYLTIDVKPRGIHSFTALNNNTKKLEVFLNQFLKDKCSVYILNKIEEYKGNKLKLAVLHIFKDNSSQSGWNNHLFLFKNYKEVKRYYSFLFED